MQKRVLVIDDEYDICHMISIVLQSYTVYKAICIEGAEKILKSENIDLIILDVWLGSGRTGLEFLQEIQNRFNIPIIIISGHGSIDMAIQAVKLGAEDFLEKPFNSDKLLILVDRIINTYSKAQKSKLLPVVEHFQIGESSKWILLHKKLSRIDIKNKVIISGPIGSGKDDAIAFLLHRLPVVNDICYFTQNDYSGIKALKNNDVAIIKVNNIDLIPLIQGNCNIFIQTHLPYKSSIEIPPISQRENDAYLLFDYFITQAEVRFFSTLKHNVDRSDIQKYSWPGNVLEISSIANQLAIDALQKDGKITKEAFLTKINAIDIYNYDIKKAKSIFEQQYLDINLKRCNKNIAHMARIIGMERSALYRKMKK